MLADNTFTLSSLAKLQEHLANRPHRRLPTSQSHHRSCKMRPELRRAAAIFSSSQRLSTSAVISSSSVRCFHCATRAWAIAHPITAHGPPPKAPTPAAEFKNDPRRVGVDQQKASQTLQGSETPFKSAARVSQANTPLKKRFWKDVNVKESSGMIRGIH